MSDAQISALGILSAIEIYRQTELGTIAQRLEQVPRWEQRETQDRTRKIKVVTDAVLLSPMHPRKDVKCLADMSKNDHHETSGAE